MCGREPLSEGDERAREAVQGGRETGAQVVCAAGLYQPSGGWCELTCGSHFHPTGQCVHFYASTVLLFCCNSVSSPEVRDSDTNNSSFISQRLWPL